MRQCPISALHIKAWLVTARARHESEQRARTFEAAAKTGRASWQEEPLHDRQRRHARELAAAERQFLEEHPEGQFTVFAHIDGAAPLVAGGPRNELARQPWWHGMLSGDGYYHGPAGSVREALSLCLRFVPARPAPSGLPDGEPGTR